MQLLYLKANHAVNKNSIHERDESFHHNRNTIVLLVHFFCWIIICYADSIVRYP